MSHISAEDKDFLINLYHEMDEIYGNVETESYEEMLLKYNFTSASSRKIARQFDVERTGHISLKYMFRNMSCSPTYTAQIAIPRDIKILSSDMGPYQQFFVIQMVQESLRYLPDMKEVVSRVKARLDSLYGALWHVFIVRGQYWAYYSHDNRTGLVIKRDDLIYIMYRSPTDQNE